MSQNIGTLVTAAIRPNDSLDLIASAYASEIKGGRHSVQTHADMESIYDVRRVEGMQCYVIDEGLTYILSGGTSNIDWIISSVDWSQISNTPTTLSGYSITDAWTSGETIDYLTANYYTQSEVYTQTEIINNYYTQTYIDIMFQTKADMINYYTSAQTDTLLTNYYTSAQTDDILTHYSTTSHTHTLSGLTDVQLNTLNALVNGDVLVYKDGDWYNSAVTVTVDMSNYYTKAEVDALIPTGGTGGSSTLWGLTDVNDNITTALDGEALVWDSTLGEWINKNVVIDMSAYYTSAQTEQYFYNSATTLQMFSLTSHTHALSGLSDVDSGATDGQYLQYSAGTWTPVTSDVLTGNYVHLTGDTMTGELVFDFMTGNTDRILYVDDYGTVTEGQDIIDLYITGVSLINYITSGDTNTQGDLLWSGSTFVNVGLSAYTIYEGQRYIDNDYFYEYMDGNLYRTYYAKKNHDHDDRYYTIDQLSGGSLDWRYLSTSSNSLIGLIDTNIDPLTYQPGDVLVYDPITGWTNSAFTQSFTNPEPTPTTIGGIEAGSSFLNADMKTMWNDLLYPYQVPVFTSFTISSLSGTYEYGHEFLANSRTFSWNISHDENLSASTIVISGPNIETTSGLDNDNSEIIYMSAFTNIDQNITNMIWNISALNSKNNTFSRNMSIQWKNRTYTASDISSLSDDETIIRTYSHIWETNHFQYVIPVGNTYTTFYIQGPVKTFSVKYEESSYADQTLGFTTSTVHVLDAGGNSIEYTKYEQYIGGVGYSADATYHVAVS